MDKLFPREIPSAEEMKRFGEKIGSTVKAGDIVALVGDLGAGKTHITQGIALSKGYTAEVTSPTFALVNEYLTAADQPDLMHFDLYRLDQAQDLLEIGWEDYLERADQGAILIIEWADRFPEMMPPGTHCILIEHLEEGRNLSYAVV